VSDSKWTCFFAVSVIVLSATLFCNWLEKTRTQKEAVERGFAEYVIASDGKTTWQWKEEK
jgi:hypothetical protein